MSYSSVRIEVPHIKTCKIIRKAEEGIALTLSLSSLGSDARTGTHLVLNPVRLTEDFVCQDILELKLLPRSNGGARRLLLIY